MFEDLGIELPADLPKGWDMLPNWLELLSAAIGRQLGNADTSGLLPFVRVAGEMQQAGGDDWAQLVLQTVLIRISDTLPEPDALADLLQDQAAYERTLRALAERSLAADPILRAATLTVAGRIALDRSEHSQAAQLLDMAAIAWSDLGVPAESANALVGLSAVRHYQGDLSGAEQAANRALAAFDELDDPVGRAMVLLNSVGNSLLGGDVDEARNRLAIVQPLVIRLRDGHLTASYHLNEANVFIETEDWVEARRRLSAAARSAQRREDLDQLLMALANLAKVTYDHESRTRGIALWQRAQQVAVRLRDWRKEQDISHSLGVYFAEAERFEESQRAFERALEINLERGNDRLVGQVRADQGAAQLAWAVWARKNDDDGIATELLREAEVTLLRAREELESVRDFRWAGIVVRNLRSTWSSGGHPDLGVKMLFGASEQYLAIDADYSAELLRNAALLGLRTELDSETTITHIEWLIAATKRERSTDDQKAWSLAREATFLSQSLELHEGAVRLFDEALGLLNPGTDPTSWGNIQNDAGLAESAAGADEAALARFRAALELADATANRALAALASANLGELSVRAGEHEAGRRYFSRAAALFEALGDVAEAARANASIANSWIYQGNHDEANLAADRALQLANESQSADALARALSATASLAYSEGNYESAYEIWSRCSSLVGPSDAGEYAGFALDCLATKGDWRRYRRVLDKLARDSQRSGTQLELTGHLHLSALTWLRAGRPKATGVILGYVVLLSFEGVIHLRKTERLDPSAGAGGDLLRLSPAFGVIRGFFTMEDVSDNERRMMRSEYERTVRRSAPDQAAELLDLVDRYALADGLED